MVVFFLLAPCQLWFVHWLMPPRNPHFVHLERPIFQLCVLLWSYVNVFQCKVEGITVVNISLCLPFLEPAVRFIFCFLLVSGTTPQNIPTSSCFADFPVYEFYPPHTDHKLGRICKSLPVTLLSLKIPAGNPILSCSYIAASC